MPHMMWSLESDRLHVEQMWSSGAQNYATVFDVGFFWPSDTKVCMSIGGNFVTTAKPCWDSVRSNLRCALEVRSTGEAGKKQISGRLPQVNSLKHVFVQSWGMIDSHVFLARSFLPASSQVGGQDQFSFLFFSSLGHL